MKLRVLDLFCGAGGAAKGYHDGFTAAGFDVDILGVDVKPQPNYPYEFMLRDAMAALGDAAFLAEFDFIHASPPCQAYGSFANINRARGRGEPKAPRLIESVRARLVTSGAAYVIENTERAPLVAPVKLCGSSFGLRVRRHRMFECSIFMLGPSCRHRGHRSWDYVGVYGSGPGGGFSGADGYERTRRAASREEASTAMGIDWMTWHELVEAIPPAYTAFLAEQIAPALMERAA